MDKRMATPSFGPGATWMRPLGVSLLILTGLLLVSGCRSNDTSFSAEQRGTGTSRAAVPGTAGTPVSSGMEQLSVEQWMTQANKACRDYRERVHSLGLPQMVADETPQQARAVADALARYVDDFERLQPPQSRADVHAAILDALKRRQAATAAYSDATSHGADPSEQDGEAMAQANTDFNEAVGRALLTDCLYSG